MIELSYQDVCTLYEGVTTIRKGKLVKVLEINAVTPITIRYRDIRTQRLYTAIFNQEDFKIPIRRIGFINFNGNAIFAARVPRRLYKAGLHITNMEFRNLLMGHADVRAVHRMEDVSFYKAYINDYPSIEEAYLQATQNNTAVAFDKQFAVSYTGSLFYKESSVGDVRDGRVVFYDNHKYLETLLDRNYEKTTRTFTPSPL